MLFTALCSGKRVSFHLPDKICSSYFKYSTVPDNTTIFSVRLHITRILQSLPGIVSTLLEGRLPSLCDACVKSCSKLVFTTDHDLFWCNGALKHGRGGVFEETAIQVEWE
jgi:hypothetical protein